MSQFATIQDFLKYLYENYVGNDNIIVERTNIKLQVILLTEEDRYRFFGTSNINTIMDERILPLLKEFYNKLANNIIPKKEILDSVETTKYNMKNGKERLEYCESKIQIAREKSETENDMDILFDCIDSILPYKEFWIIVNKFSKLYYIILISILHKKIDGLLQTIDELRSLIYELDEKMSRLLKIDHELFNEQDYIFYSSSSKTVYKILDGFVECINDGYDFE